MSRVITFSRFFPPYHPRAGKPTYFVEKIWNSIGFENAVTNEGMFNTVHSLTGYDVDLIQSFFDTLGNDVNKKHTTIRTGHRWKAGDWFSPRVWSGKPYRSKMIQFAPDMQIKKTWDFEMDINGVCSIAKPGKQVIYTFEYDDKWPDSLDDEIAKNDGLSPEDFYWWFSRSPNFKNKKGFDGQIICWNESIEY